MADDETTENTPNLSDTDSSEDESDAPPIESLVAGRERRKTAGNRYDRDMVLEESGNGDEPDEVELLFADNEEEEDEEFRSDAEDEDADMSSSDDDDQGPNTGPDDMEGEKEIQKQAKEERAKKRKADLALTSVAGVRKKLKTDPTRPAAPSAPSKPSKKKERVTWVHDQDSGRSSLRKQTIAHRAETIARLKESEAQSKKLKALKEQRDKERARDAPKQLTQADRLAEAARVERQNAKSLNRWEALEKKRQEEQAAKLAALKNRKLEGPVVTWLSQKAKWLGPELSKLGTKDVADLAGPKKRGRKSKAELELLAAEKAGGLTVPTSGQTTTDVTTTSAATPLTTSTSDQTQPLVQEKTPETLPLTTPETLPLTAPAVEGPQPQPQPQPQITLSAPEETQDSFLHGIHEYATLQSESNPPGSNQASPVLPESKTPPDLDPKGKSVTEETTQVDSLAASVPASMEVAVPTQDTPVEGVDIVAVKVEPPNEQPPTNTPLETEPPQPIPIPIPMIIDLSSAPEPPPVEEDSTRNLVILEKFDELSTDARQEYSIFYNKKTAKAARAVKHNQALCPITTAPVRYRDTSTGIAYANVVAYKKLQGLKEHKYSWSSMLGCYVGLEGGVVARGVPEGWT